MSELTPHKERFLHEVEQKLLRKELDAKLLDDGLIHIRWNEKPLCSVDRDGIVRFRPADITGSEVDRKLRTVTQVAAQVKEYMQIFDRAPALKAVGLDDTYKVLADFGDAVLAGRSCKTGAKFVTWEWDFDRQGVHAGHYFMENYLSGVDLAAEGELERINQLADRLEHMSEVDCDKFAGMLDANSISGTRDILRLTEHLDDYVILPGCGSAQSIGKYLVGCGAFPVPEKLIGYINYEAVGIEFCDAHGGAACSRGYVVRKEGLPQELLDELHDQKQTQEMTL